MQWQDVMQGHVKKRHMLETLVSVIRGSCNIAETTLAVTTLLIKAGDNLFERKIDLTPTFSWLTKAEKSVSGGDGAKLTRVTREWHALMRTVHRHKLGAVHRQWRGVEFEAIWIGCSFSWASELVQQCCKQCKHMQCTKESWGQDSDGSWWKLKKADEE